MYSIETKSEESRAIQNNAEKHIPTAQFKDNRSQNETEKNTTAQLEKKENLTGMPDDLKEGIESLSGFSMDDVRVHYNSSKPATVQALAYTQGTDIHVAPGQEKHLPHEAWHVAQQMAGRVSPTTNINGMPVNDNVELEQEADVMGEKAVQCKPEKYDNTLIHRNQPGCLTPVQMVREDEFKKNPEEFMKKNGVLCDFSLGLQVRMRLDRTLADSFLSLMKESLFDEHWFVLTPYKDLLISPSNPSSMGVYILTPAVEKYKLHKILAGICASQINGNELRKQLLLNLYQVCRSFKSDNTTYIEASFIPYKFGSPSDFEQTVGHAQVKKSESVSGENKWNPDFVFTEGMNGCSLVFTEEDGDSDDSFTVWHFQSPGSYKKGYDRFREEKKIFDSFSWEDYGNPFDYEYSNAGATNFLWRSKENGWHVISQFNHTLQDEKHVLKGIKTEQSKSCPVKFTEK